MKEVKEGKKIKIYKPELIIEDPLLINNIKKKYNTRLFEALKNGKRGLIDVKLDDEVVIQRISKDLYRSYESGIRELLNNEVRAAEEAKSQYNAKPKIMIAFNPLTKELTIEGKDSLGISSERFLELLRYLGRSDNLDGKSIGQFGFGFASYVTLSDTIVLETYSRETNERFALLGKSGIGFDILPEPLHLTQYGTRVTLAVTRKGITSREIIQTIEKYAMFKKIPIYLETKEDIPMYEDRQYNVNQARVFLRKGIKLISMKTFKEELEKEQEKNNNYKYIYIELHDDDYDFIGKVEVYVSHSGYYRTYYSNRHLNTGRGSILLVETSIGMSDLYPFKDFYLNIKDERKYMPTTDRERLKDESLQAILKKVKGALVKKIISEIKWTDFKSLLKEPTTKIIFWAEFVDNQWNDSVELEMINKEF